MGSDPKPPRIITPRLILRLAESRDVPELVRFVVANRVFHAHWEPVRSEAYYTEAHWQDQVGRSLDAFRDDRGLNLLLLSAEDDQSIIGRLNFSNFVRGSAQFCHCGYALDESRTGCGFMREALAAGIEYVFGELRMHRVMANYMPRNERSARLLESLGFVVEGRAKEYLIINGKWEDHVLTSLVNPRWTPDDS